MRVNAKNEGSISIYAQSTTSCRCSRDRRFGPAVAEVAVSPLVSPRAETCWQKVWKWPPFRMREWLGQNQDLTAGQLGTENAKWL